MEDDIDNHNMHQEDMKMSHITLVSNRHRTNECYLYSSTNHSNRATISITSIFDCYMYALRDIGYRCFRAQIINSSFIHVLQCARQYVTVRLAHVRTHSHY